MPALPIVGCILLYTVGHSTRSPDQLLDILRTAGVGAVVDVRTFPSSRRYPHFNGSAVELEKKNGLGQGWGNYSDHP